MVGQRQRIHAQFFGPRNKIADRARPIQQTVMAMAMQMSKRRRSHGDSLLQMSDSNVILPAPSSSCHATQIQHKSASLGAGQYGRIKKAEYGPIDEADYGVENRQIIL